MGFSVVTKIPQDGLAAVRETASYLVDGEEEGYSQVIEVSFSYKKGQGKIKAKRQLCPVTKG